MGKLLLLLFFFLVRLHVRSLAAVVYTNQSMESNSEQLIAHLFFVCGIEYVVKICAQWLCAPKKCFNATTKQ